MRADATDTTWALGNTSVAAASLTTVQAFEVEDRILHFTDVSFGDEFKGFVDVVANQAIVTTDTFDFGAGPTVLNGSINRAVEVLSTGGTILIEAGTYSETLAAAGAGVSLSGTGVTLNLDGAITGDFTTESGIDIVATGALTIGASGGSDNITLGGGLAVGANTVTLNDGSGSTTSLGSSNDVGWWHTDRQLANPSRWLAARHYLRLRHHRR